jgi:hypothetical protein
MLAPVRARPMDHGAKMIGQNHSYRYYYYYGPLSTWRDGRARGCFGVII